MENLNLKRVWEICNKLSYEQSILEEKGIFVSLLGNRSSFSAYSFERFLEYYSFKIEEDNIVVYNTDPIPYEKWDNDDVSYIPIPVLGFGEKELENYIEQMIKIQLKEQEEQKIAEKENIKKQIEFLQKKLEN
jgi:hypothetical protein